MCLRWKKSWIRESLIAAAFMWRKSPVAAVSFFGALLFPFMAPVIVFRAFVLMPILTGSPGYLYLWGVAVMSFFYSVYYLRMVRSRLWLYGVMFCFLYMSILTWQLPWALITSSDNKWGTR